MRIQCEKCSAAYSVKDDLLSEEPLGVQCPYCGNVQLVTSSGSSVTRVGSDSGESISLESGLELTGPRAVSSPNVKTTDGTPLGGVATLCQDCGRRLTEEFDQVIGLCDEHQAKRKAYLGILTEENVSTIPRQASAVPRKNSSRVSIAPRKAQPGSAIARLFWIALLIGGLGVGGYYGYEHRAELQQLADKHIFKKPAAEPPKPNPLAEWLDVWRMALGQVQGRPADYFVKANTHYLADTWGDYEKADDILKRALVLSPSSPIAIGLFVENLAIWRGKSLTAKEVATSKNALRFAEPKPEELLYIRRAQAALALTQGDLLGCREFGEQAIALGKDDARARVLVASSYLDGNSNLAMQELEEALRLDRQFSRAKRLLAYAQAKDGRYASALALLEERLKRAPKDATLHVQTGNLRTELGQLSKAQVHYEKAIQGVGDRLSANVRLGNNFLAQSKADEAAKKFNAVIHGRGAHVAQKAAAFVGHARANVMKANYQEAYRQSAEALRLFPKESTALLVKAEAALLTGGATKAISLAEMVLSVKGDSAEALAIHAIGNLELKLPQRAAKTLERATGTGANDPRLLTLLYAAYLGTGQVDFAAKTLKTLRNVDPKDNAARRAAFAPRLSEKTWKRARSFLRPRSQKGSDVAEAYSVLAVLLHYSGDQAGADKALQLALKAEESSLLARLYHAYFYLSANKRAEAVESAKTILDIERSSAIGQLMLARAEKANGSLGNAKAAYESALLSSPGLTIAKVELAGMALEAGQKSQAIKVLTEAFRLYPSLQTTRHLLLAAGY